MESPKIGKNRKMPKLRDSINIVIPKFGEIYSGRVVTRAYCFMWENLRNSQNPSPATNRKKLCDGSGKNRRFNLYS